VKEKVKEKDKDKKLAKLSKGKKSQQGKISVNEEYESREITRKRIKSSSTEKKSSKADYEQSIPIPTSSYEEEDNFEEFCFMAQEIVPDVEKGFEALACDQLEIEKDECEQIVPVQEGRVAPSVAGGFEQLVGLQQFTGNWDAQSIAKVARVPLQQILKAKPDDVSDDIWATACGIALLEIHWSTSKSIWGMVAKKARVFIIKELSKTGIDTATATNKAEEIIKTAQKEMQ